MSTLLALTLLSLLQLSLGAAVYNSSAYTSGSYGAAPYQTFVSRPDLQPPLLNFINYGQATPGYLFANMAGAPQQPGLVIMDGISGELVYMNTPTSGKVFNFRRQVYRGKEVFTTWSGLNYLAWGFGGYNVYDNTYNLIANFTTHGVPQGDIHEFRIYNETTAIVDYYEVLPMDLTQYGGPANGYITNCGFQEIDIATNTLLFTWSALDHVSPSESYYTIGAAGSSASDPWDFFHINCIDKKDNNGYLVSGRHSHTLYYVSAQTKQIVWRMGGKTSDFSIGPGANFEWQHDPEWRSENTISIFDNADANGAFISERQTRGLLIQFNLSNMSVTLVTQLLNPFSPLCDSQGNLQLLPNGNFWMGYGRIAMASEYSPSGQIIQAVLYAPQPTDQYNVQSYQVHKTNWTGFPTTNPDLAVLANTTAGSDSYVVYVSWNGATEVSSWSVYTGVNASSLQFFSNSPRTGFETVIPIVATSRTNYVRATALDSNGNSLGSSTATPLTATQVPQTTAQQPTSNCPSTMSSCGAACYSPSQYCCVNGNLVQYQFCAVQASTSSANAPSSTTSTSKNAASSSTSSSAQNSASSTAASNQGYVDQTGPNCPSTLYECSGACYSSSSYCCLNGALTQKQYCGAAASPATSSAAASGPSSSSSVSASTFSTSTTSQSTTSSSAAGSSAANICAGRCQGQSCCATPSGSLCYVPSSYSCTSDDLGNNYLCPTGMNSCGGACYNPSNYHCNKGNLQQGPA